MPGSARIELAKERSGHSRLAKAELAILKQEWLLAELLGTGEPTAETIAHLAELRRAVERAQLRKNGHSARI